MSSIRTKWNHRILTELNSIHPNTNTIESFELFGDSSSYYKDCKRILNTFTTKQIVDILIEFFQLIKCPFDHLDKSIDSSIQSFVKSLFIQDCEFNQLNLQTDNKLDLSSSASSSANTKNKKYNINPKHLWSQGDPPISETFDTMDSTASDENYLENTELPSENDNFVIEDLIDLTKEELDQFKTKNINTLNTFKKNNKWIQSQDYEDQVALYYIESYLYFISENASFDTIDFLKLLDDINVMLSRPEVIKYVKSIPLPADKVEGFTARPQVNICTQKPGPKNKQIQPKNKTQRKQNGIPTQKKMSCEQQYNAAKPQLNKTKDAIKTFIYEIMALPILMIIVYNLYHLFFSKKDYEFQNGKNEYDGVQIMTEFGCEHYKFANWEKQFRDFEKGYTNIATDFLFKPTLLFSICMNAIQNSKTLNNLNKDFPFLIMIGILLILFASSPFFSKEISSILNGFFSLNIPSNSVLYNIVKTVTWWYFAWRCIDSWIWFFIPIPFVNPYIHIDAPDIPTVFPVVIKFIIKLMVWILKGTFTSMLLPLSTFILVIYILFYFVFGIFKDEGNVRQHMAFIDQFIYTKLYEPYENEDMWYKKIYNIGLKLILGGFNYLVEIIFLIILLSSTRKCLSVIDNNHLKSIFIVLCIVICLILGMWGFVKYKYYIYKLDFHYDKKELNKSGLYEEDKDKEITYNEHKKSFRVKLDNTKCDGVDNNKNQHQGIISTFFDDYQLSHDTFFTHIYSMIFGSGKDSADKYSLLNRIIPKEFTGAFDKIKDKVTNIVGNPEFVNKISETFAAKTSSMLDQAKNVTENLGADAQNVANKLGEDVQNVANKLGADAQNVANKLGEDVQNVANKLGEDVQNVAKSAIENGTQNDVDVKNFANTTVDGITNSALKNLTNITNTLKMKAQTR